ncbi:beta-galactosidase [Opitutaceae bacterium EW11]|nr:beta-galactosidase [Opitutaceae bacterium EW11]
MPHLLFALHRLFRFALCAFASSRRGPARLLVFAAFLFVGILRADEPRQVFNFNCDWAFQLGDVYGAERVAFNDAAWSRVGLPHSFSIPYFAAGNAFYVGYGWYRKHFEVPEGLEGKRLFLDFDGAFQDAEIFLNGVKVGAHQGGYTGFEIEITDALVKGANVLAVRLNNRWNARLAPRGGEHVFSGGLYRNVWLTAMSPLHVTWYGTFVTTPKLSASSGVVRVMTEVANQSSAAKACELNTEVVDTTGRVVANMSSVRTIPPGQTVTFEHTSVPIPNPQLWSPETPTLYRAISTIVEEGKPVDRYETPFGFRWFEWTADRGFFLNGKSRYVRGANVHQDHAGWGDAVTNSGARRDLQLMKDAGFDFIRGSHYPHSPAFSKACDELGLLFWSENCFWGTAGSHKDGYWDASTYPIREEDEHGFEESVRAALRDMIRIHRNHPSIVAWSMGNETFFSAPEVMPKVRRFLRELVDYTHELDPSRPAAVGGVQRGEIDRIGDVAGYNGDGARIQQYINPGVPNIVSEYGSTSVDRPGDYEPGWGDLPALAGLDLSRPYPWRFPWRSGEVIWCGFDHGSIAGRRFGAMGMVDYFRLPKRQWYWYRNEYRHIPPPKWPADGIPAGLRLAADKTTLRSVDGTDDAQIVVSVVDKEGNPLRESPTVTLSIDSGPGEFPTGPSIVFAADSDIAIRDGSAAIEFRSYHAGETIVRASSPGLADATIKIVSLGAPKYVPGVTPPVSPRPYRRFEASADVGNEQTFGQQNPTRVSSEAERHSGRFANDGDVSTFWQSAAADTQPWLRVDMERVVAVKRIKLTFPCEGAWRYLIEVSEDGENRWKTVADRSATENLAKERSDVVEGAPVKSRFVRVTLVGHPDAAPPSIAEIQVFGALVGE